MLSLCVEWRCSAALHRLLETETLILTHPSSSSLQASPIVQVALLPKNVGDLPLLVEGLRLLNQADAFVEVTVQTNGEHVLGAAGEVHLERCIKDLEERFAGVPLNVRGPPCTHGVRCE
jgi:translation elongation factor EF-G